MLEFKTMAKRRAANEYSPFRCLLAGEPDSGKTSALAWLANAGYDVYVLDFDADKTAGLNERLTDKGAECFNIISVESDYDDKLKRVKKNTAYQKAKEIIKEMCDQGILDNPNTVLVLDTLTNLTIDISLVEERTDGRATVLDSYNEALNFIGMLFVKTKRSNIILLGHTIDVDQPKSSILRTGINFFSKKYSLEISQFAGFNNVFVIEKGIKGEHAGKVNIITKSGYLGLVKNQYTGIPEKCDPDWFFPSIIHRHRTGEWKYPNKTNT